MNQLEIKRMAPAPKPQKVDGGKTGKRRCKRPERACGSRFAGVRTPVSWDYNASLLEP